MSNALQRSVVAVSLVVAGAVSLSAASDETTRGEWVSAWPGPQFPEDSAYWWTVSGQVSPADLKATLTDPEANEARYRQALLEGEERQWPLPDANTRFVPYVHGSLTPDLMPLWVAYQSVGLWLRMRSGPFWDPDRPQRELRERLRLAGLSNEGAETVIAVIEEAQREFETLNREAEPMRRRFHQVWRRAAWLLGTSGATRALYLGDDALIARASFTRTSKVRRLREVWNANYLDQVGLQATEMLKARLAAEDWEHFKSYLLVEVVPGLRYIDVEERPPEAQPYTVLIRLLIAFALFVGMPAMWVYRRIRRTRQANPC